MYSDHCMDAFYYGFIKIWKGFVFFLITTGESVWLLLSIRNIYGIIWKTRVQIHAFTYNFEKPVTSLN